MHSVCAQAFFLQQKNVWEGMFCGLQVRGGGRASKLAHGKGLVNWLKWRLSSQVGKVCGVSCNLVVGPVPRMREGLGPPFCLYPAPSPVANVCKSPVDGPAPESRPGEPLVFAFGGHPSL